MPGSEHTRSDNRPSVHLPRRGIDCAMLLMSCMSFVGCSGPQATTQPNQRAQQPGQANTQPATQQAKDDRESPDGDTLANRIQQDVQAFRQMQDQSSSNADSSRSGNASSSKRAASPAAKADRSSDESDPSRTRSRTRIIWNDPTAKEDPNSESTQRDSSRREKSTQANEPADTSKPSSPGNQVKTVANNKEKSDQRDSKDSESSTNKERSTTNTESNTELRQLLVDLSKRLYRESTYDDMPLRQLLVISATTMVSPDRALQPDAIHGLTDRERELLGAFQDFFLRVGEDLDGSKPAEIVLTESVRELQQSINRQPTLKIPSVRLCTSVRGFADYDEFENNRFLAGTEQQAVVYTEVDEFTSKLNDDGEWVTEISQRLTIYDRDGIPVWRQDWQSAVDRSRKKRRDFFITQVITLPDALGVGKFNLKVHLRDEQSGAEAETGLSFELVADPKLAAEGAR